MAFEVMPAIDLRRGRCVRLLQGDPGWETVYGDDPPAMAAHWTRLHVVDLDGAFDGRPGNLPRIEAMLAGGSAPLQVGGGIRDEAAALAAELGIEAEERLVLPISSVDGCRLPECPGPLSRRLLAAYREELARGV